MTHENIMSMLSFLTLQKKATAGITVLSEKTLFLGQKVCVGWGGGGGGRGDSCQLLLF